MDDTNLIKGNRLRENIQTTEDVERKANELMELTRNALNSYMAQVDEEATAEPEPSIISKRGDRPKTEAPTRNKRLTTQTAKQE